MIHHYSCGFPVSMVAVSQAEFR